MTRPTVLGAGSWGTALALVLARRNLPVKLWVHNPDFAAKLNEFRSNERYLPGFSLPPSVAISSNLADCVNGCDALIVAIPSHAVRNLGERLRPVLPPDSCIISASKGIEENTLQTMSEVLEETCAADNLVVISGPSFAHEVARELPTAIVAASIRLNLAEGVQRLFSGPRFRLYASNDVRGVELGGAMKNIIAIAAGVCSGLELGHNAIAALITRGLAEMTRLAISLGAQPQTLAGLAGLGDLVLTCNGELSRNRQVGIQLASGKNVNEITAEMKSVAEGIRTTNSIVALGHRQNVNLPISVAMQAVLEGRQIPSDAIRILMDRSLRGE